MRERDWSITTGFYAEHQFWRGGSTFLAGLNWARLHRHWPFGPGRVPHTAHSIVDLDSLDEGGDSKTDDESEFFDRCAMVGARRGKRLDSAGKKRRPWA